MGVVYIYHDDKIKIDSDETRKALEYMKKLMAVNPPEVYAWDDAGNNRWIISGKGSGIMNPPSSWAVAKRDNPDVAKNIWHHAMPKGPKGRFVGQLPQFYGLWQFSKNKSAAKDLLHFNSQRAQVAQLVEASYGYDLPSFKSLYDLDTWKKVEPPLGTAYSYPPRGDEETSMFGQPARAEVGAQMYNQAINTVMVAKFTQGNEKLDAVIKWAANELEGTLRACAPAANSDNAACRPGGPACATLNRRYAFQSDDSRRSPHGRHSPALDGGTIRRRAHSPQRHRQIHASAIDHRIHDVPAADPDHLLPCHLSGLLFDLAVDAEQGADQVHRPRQLPLPVVPRRVLDGGAAIGDLRDLRRVLQSADRPDHRAPDQQSAGERPAQVARHAAGAVGHSAGAVVARLVVAVRPDAFGLQLHPPELRLRRDSVAVGPLLGPLLGDPGQRVVRRTLLPDHVSRGAEIGARTALRSRVDRRRQRLAELRAHHAADDAQHHGDHYPVLAHRHLRQFRRRADHDCGRAAQHDARVRDLLLPARHSFGWPAAGR